MGLEKGSCREYRLRNETHQVRESHVCACGGVEKLEPTESQLIHAKMLMQGAVLYFVLMLGNRPIHAG